MYYKVTMTGVIISGVNQTDSTDPARIVERVSILADTFLLEYTPVNLKGGLGETTKFGWDCLRNAKF